MSGYTANTIRRKNKKFILCSPLFRSVVCLAGIKDKRDRHICCSSLTFNKQHAFSWCSPEMRLRVELGCCCCCCFLVRQKILRSQENSGKRTRPYPVVLGCFCFPSGERWWPIEQWQCGDSLSAPTTVNPGFENTMFAHITTPPTPQNAVEYFFLSIGYAPRKK